jgi:phosphatidylserine decarboxylase
MRDQLFIFLQFILPQHFVTRVAGWLAECNVSWLKNLLIRTFTHNHGVDLAEAVRKKPEDYVSFNDFFIRQIDMSRRPIAKGATDIACPVDGVISAVGDINKDSLLQAKSHYYSLLELLGGDATLTQSFYDGKFITLYLAPHNYHRVHMPITGKLIKTIYVPGKLFSVNRITADHIPNLFSRNERLICLFDTEAGPLVIVLVGAIIVGSIQTVWMNQPVRENKPFQETFANGMTIEKGGELGYFKLGSTVILLFEKNRAQWESLLNKDLSVQVGQLLGNFQTQ